ncbi:MAG: helix-turn-helix transcriptional regulator, partial [Pseudomonadales bacterium]|nr:helix-turn-helix transcriptional regulator [Pseudomonadales bacterium]
MDSGALVQLALEALSCSQKELATHLNVSPTQISKWKKGEHMSHDMEKKLRAISNIGDRIPSFVLEAGSLEAAVKWERLIHYLAERANEYAETGYDTPPLRDDIDFLCWDTFHVLKEMGVALPHEFPKELDRDYERDESGSAESAVNLRETIDQNPYSSLIYKIYQSMTDVYGFYAAYVSELINDDNLDLFDTPAEDFESCLLSLAASKVEVDPEFAPNKHKFTLGIEKDYEEWITIVKDKAFRAGIPLKAELLDLVNEDNDVLAVEAEEESSGINASRVHPDIYMDELLT